MAKLSNLYNIQQNSATRKNMTNYPNAEDKKEPRTVQNKWGLVLLAIFLLSVAYAATLRVSNPRSLWIMTPIIVMCVVCIPGILILEKVYPEKLDS